MANIESVKAGNDVDTTKSRTRVILFSKSIGALYELVDFFDYDTTIYCLTGATVKHVPVPYNEMNIFKLRIHSPQVPIFIIRNLLGGDLACR